MSAIKEYWRTSTIIIALVVILAMVISFPGNESVARKVNEVHYLSMPQEGQCYLSVGLMHRADSMNIGQDIGGQLDAFSKMVGKNQTVYFDVWGDMWDRKEAYWQLDAYDQLLDDGKIKAIGVNLWPCVRADSYRDNYTVKQIANGEQDDFVIEQARHVRDFGYPVFIRFGAEFNIYQGQTFEGQTKEGTYIFGQNPQDFIAAWRHYVDVFRSENVTNAIFMWNPNYADFGPHHYTEYYPGDEYVDWVGVDIYQYESNFHPAGMLQGVYNDYSARKPIAVAEWGTDWPNLHISDSDRARFVSEFFDAVESMPRIKMVNYWYYQDFKFDEKNQPITVATYADKISDARYIG